MNVNDGFIIPTIAESLKKVCIDNKVSDPDLILDIYLVCSNKGTSFIPDEELLKDIDRFDPAFWTSRSQIAQRKDFLESLATSTYMEALIKLNDPMKAVLVFVEQLKKAQEARALAASKTQNIDHASGSFSGTYIDQNGLDEIQRARATPLSFDLIYKQLTTYQDILESEELSAFISSGCGAGRYYDATESSSSQLAGSVVSKGQELPKMYPLLFEVFTKLSEKLGLAKLKDKDSDEEKDRKRVDQMEDHTQVSTVDPTEVAHETFDAKVANKNLDVKYNIEEKEGISHLFVLLDVSGSMMAQDLGGRVCRAFASNVITLALLQFAMKGNYKVWVVPFAGAPSRTNMQTAMDKTSALNAMKWLGRQSYNGSSTDIEAAVRFAYKNVSEDPTYKKCDIVLITDGCSPINPSLKTDKPARTILRSLFISHSLRSYGGHIGALIAASDTHQKITWDNAKNELTVGNALDGINEEESSLGIHEPTGAQRTAPADDDDDDE
jgi:Mg-chelatase subunit ChlD